MRVRHETRLPDDLVSKFWALYKVAFQPLEVASPCRQYLLEDEFRDEMADERVLKFVLEDDGDPVSMAFVATNLSAIPWISPPYFRATFPEQYERNAIFYFGALLTVPDRRRAGYVDHLLAELINFVAEHDGIAAFDCCLLNDAFLPALIHTAADTQTNLRIHRLDVQSYYGYEALGFKEGYGPGKPFGDHVRPHQRSGDPVA